MNLEKSNYRLPSKYDFGGFDVGEKRTFYRPASNVRAAVCMWLKRKGVEFKTVVDKSGTILVRTK